MTRLTPAKQMKPLGFHLDEMRELLAALDPSSQADPAYESESERLARLREFSAIADRRCADMRARPSAAEGFAAMLRMHITHSGAATR